MKFDVELFKESSEFKDVETMFSNYMEDRSLLNSLLINNVELTSFYSGYNDIFIKTFTVACGNAFEKKLTKEIPLLLSRENPLGLNFLKNQALDRKFHTLFQWDKKNANKFFSLFGNDFKEYIEGKIKVNEVFKSYERDFLELGNLRNLIVHEGIYSYTLVRNIESIYMLFKNSLSFVVFICETLCEYFGKKFVYNH